MLLTTSLHSRCHLQNPTTPLQPEQAAFYGDRHAQHQKQTVQVCNAIHAALGSMINAANTTHKHVQLPSTNCTAMQHRDHSAQTAESEPLVEPAQEQCPYNARLKGSTTARLPLEALNHQVHNEIRCFMGSAVDTAPVQLWCSLTQVFYCHTLCLCEERRH
jgi:hypothetical protein